MGFVFELGAAASSPDAGLLRAGKRQTKARQRITGSFFIVYSLNGGATGQSKIDMLRQPNQPIVVFSPAGATDHCQLTTAAARVIVPPSAGHFGAASFVITARSVLSL